MSKRAFVVSDMHIGGGAADPALEDFVADEEFAAWVDSISSPGTTLVLNGDIIDFAQIPPYDVPEDDSRLLWTEAISLEKARLAYEEHPRCFDGLRGFLGAGGRLHMNIGNHDLDMVWPRVQAWFCQVVGAQSGQVEFAMYCEYAGVFIEHGHQFTPENCPADANEFVHKDAHGTERLERVWGTDFMLHCYNEIERRHPYADVVKPMTTVLYHGIKNRWISGGHLWRLLAFLRRRGLPWDGMASSLLHQDEVTLQEAIGSVPNEQWRAMLVEGLHEPAFEDALHKGLDALTSGERAVLIAPEEVELVDPTLGEDVGTLGLFRDDREERWARKRLAMDGITHVIFGHTHRIVDGELNGHLFNPGTWIPHLKLESPAVAAKIKKRGLTFDLLDDKRYYEAERCAVLIEPDAHNQAHVRLERVA